jgi:transcriptional regulator with XRE-family HTH domain
MGQLFGNYLREVRLAAGLSQKDLAERANVESEKSVTQSVLAQYEGGSVTIPDSKVLIPLSTVLNVPLRDFIFRVALDIADSYRTGGYTFSKSDEFLFKTWQTVLHGGDLKSLSEFLEEFNLRDLDSLAEWQRNYNETHTDRNIKLEVFWVIAPNFRDNANTTIQKAVLENISKGVHYYYFIRKGDDDAGGSLFVLRDSLKFGGKEHDPVVSEQQVDAQVHPVNIPPEVAGLILSDLVIANPFSAEPEGFRSIRSGGRPKFGVKVDAGELTSLINNYRSYFSRLDPSQDVGPPKGSKE